MVVVNKVILKKEHECPCTGSAINTAKLTIQRCLMVLYPSHAGESSTAKNLSLAPGAVPGC